MADILTRAGCFIAIILLGMVLRRVGFFKQEDFYVLSKIVVKITLTAAIVKSFVGRELEPSMIILTLIGFGFGVLLIVLGVVMNLHKAPKDQAFAALNQSGCNISNFVLPFTQSFLGPVGVMAVALFDVGNAFICLGGSYSIAAMIQDRSGGISLKKLFVSFGKSVPLMTYIIMTVLSALKIQLPNPVVEFTGIIANANAFMAMLMIGVGFRLSGSREQLGDIVRIIGVRYAAGFALALLGWYLLPFPLEYRQALVMCTLAPIASTAPAFTAELKGDFGLSSAVNSISILISIVLITGSLLLILV